MKINYKKTFQFTKSSCSYILYNTFNKTLSSSEIYEENTDSLLIRKKTFINAFCFQYYAQINTFNTVVNFIVFEKYQKLVVQLSLLLFNFFPLYFFVNGSLSQSARRQKYFIKPCVLPIHRLITEITHTHNLFVTKLQHQESRNIHLLKKICENLLLGYL